MSVYRLNRLFNPQSRRALDVAVDHGFFGERSFLTGIEDMAAVVRTLVAANPDAVQLTLGHARLLQAVPGKQKPALVLRSDVANVYGNPLDEHLFSHHVPNAIEEAVRLDAVAICANLMQLPGRPEIREANIRSIMALRAEATTYAHAADDRTAGDAGQCRRRRIHGRWGHRQDHDPGPPGTGAGC